MFEQIHCCVFTISEVHQMMFEPGPFHSVVSPSFCLTEAHHLFHSFHLSQRWEKDEILSDFSALGHLFSQQTKQTWQRLRALFSPHYICSSLHWMWGGKNLVSGSPPTDVEVVYSLLLSWKRSPELDCLSEKSLLYIKTLLILRGVSFSWGSK